MLLMVYPQLIVPKSVPGGANSASMGFANNAAAAAAAQASGSGGNNNNNAMRDSGSTSSAGDGNHSSTNANNAGGAGDVNMRGGQHGGAATGGANAAVKAERFRPRIFGFQLHESAKLMRWQEAMRDKQVDRLERLVIE